jgi:A/G-specific adenine glycosylase
MPEAQRSFFTHALMLWHSQHSPRQMPWKGEREPYRIWLSEVILQQTRVAQGLPYYERFVAQYPTVQHLANAPLNEVLKCWEGLGYYSRARNLWQTAGFVTNELDGEFPTDYEGLLKLKGIGPYTAAAVASFAYREPRAVVDGNVQRVLARYFGIEAHVDSTAGKNLLAKLAQNLIDTKRPDLYNQAIMDFGATVCMPKAPLCADCPLVSRCIALAKDKTGTLPVKRARPARRERFFHYLVFTSGSHTWLRQRNGNDIWKGLFEFPLLEADYAMQADDVGRKFSALLQPVSAVSKTQLLTHQKISALFFRGIGLPADTAGLLQVPISELRTFAFPRVVDWYLRDNLLLLEH